MNRSCISQTTLVLLLVVSTSCPALYAGFRPEQQVITTDADGADSVYAADLDGDGDVDVLSSSFEDGKIAWYANDGSGQFGPQQAITTEADGAWSVYAADLDGDGDLDVLSASYGSWTGSGYDSKIAWYANDGSGRFGAQQVITTEAKWATSVYAADFDGDGDLDVVSGSAGYSVGGSWSGGGVAWYANDGSGHFGPQQVISAEARGATSVYGGDFDGDGDLDVVSASTGGWVGASWSRGTIAWYANDGSGHFGAQQVIATETDYAASVYAADLDGDGDLDVLSASASFMRGGVWVDGKIAWYANDGSGHFSPQEPISTVIYQRISVYAADLDGDADLDVLSASYYHGDTGGLFDSRVAWYANDGLGHFGRQQIITTGAGQAICVYAADLDRDGDRDVLSASYDDDKIAWYANHGSGGFGSQRVITTEALWARCVCAADLDGDGDRDVLSATTCDSRSDGSCEIAWHANDGLGQFGPQQVITTGLCEQSFVSTADLDGDGDLDVLSASEDRIAWHANDGSGQFGPQQVITTRSTEASIAYAADLDGDGDLDILASSGYYPLIEGKIAWYANDGSGQFGTQRVITTEAREAISVHAADLDGDGDLDVLSASWQDDKIAWYANDGSGQFGPQQVITTAADGAPTVYAADLDGDGDQDVLAASWDDGKIAWYPNDGSGQFGSQQVITTGPVWAHCVRAADLDGDGDLDVLSAEGKEVAWYANDGSGGFGPRQVISSDIHGAVSVYTADLDGDGDLDVLSAGGKKIAWYENE